MNSGSTSRYSYMGSKKVVLMELASSRSSRLPASIGLRRSLERDCRPLKRFTSLHHLSALLSFKSADLGLVKFCFPTFSFTINDVPVEFKLYRVRANLVEGTTELSFATFTRVPCVDKFVGGSSAFNPYFRLSEYCIMIGHTKWRECLE